MNLVPKGEVRPIKTGGDGQFKYIALWTCKVWGAQVWPVGFVGGIFAGKVFVYVVWVDAGVDVITFTSGDINNSFVGTPAAGSKYGGGYLDIAFYCGG